MENSLPTVYSSSPLNELVVDTLDETEPSSQSQLADMLEIEKNEPVIRKILLKVKPEKVAERVVLIATSKNFSKKTGGLAFNRIKEVSDWRLRKKMYKAVMDLTADDFRRKIAKRFYEQLFAIVDINYRFVKNT